MSLHWGRVYCSYNGSLRKQNARIISFMIIKPHYAIDSQIPATRYLSEVTLTYLGDPQNNMSVTSTATFDAYVPLHDILKKAVFISTVTMLRRSD